MSLDSITLPYWYDLHVHFRQGNASKEYIQAHLDMGCAGALAMPNTKPPVARVQGVATDEHWTIESYRNFLMQSGADQFDALITPLYLTPETTPQMIIDGAQSGLLQSCKYYPPHGTTNADFGASLQTYMDNGVFAAMSEAGVILNIHGEEHALQGEDYFGEDSNAEDYFYRERMTHLVDQYPNLKIVCEHITTRTAAKFVQSTSDNIAATITPQHLLYTVGHLLQGFKYHLYCLPLIKFEKDRQALLEAVQTPGQTKFFAGTDSAPHTQKCTPCGCAAGCFTGYIAPQLYAQAFDLNAKNKDLFQAFLCDNGRDFYDLPLPRKKFTLKKQPCQSQVLITQEGQEVVPLSIGMGQETLEWTLIL